MKKMLFLPLFYLILEDCTILSCRIGPLEVHRVRAAGGWTLADVGVGARAHEHELMVEVILPQELFGQVDIGGETHIARQAHAADEDVAAIDALQQHLSIAAVNEAEEVVLLGALQLSSVGRGFAY